jgi:molybdopterin molybdotransferase
MGADAVIMQEDTKVDGENVLALDAVKPWENIRFAGEDVKAGAGVAQAGDRVNAGLLGLLAATGVAEATVFKRPRIAILATGSELRAPGESLKPGEIFESNRLVVAALVRRIGAVAEIKPVVADDLTSTMTELREAAGADAIITCGGVSVGEFDFVKSAIEQLGGALNFWRVAVKPGKPFLHATVLGKPLFGLPGNPVSSLVTFWLLVRPALLRMAGAGEVAPPMTLGELADEVSNKGDRRQFVRVRIDPNGLARMSGPQASHRLGSLAAANGLLDVPAGARWEAGRRVQVLRLD